MTICQAGPSRGITQYNSKLKLIYQFNDISWSYEYYHIGNDTGLQWQSSIVGITTKSRRRTCRVQLPSSAGSDKRPILGVHAYIIAFQVLSHLAIALSLFLISKFLEGTSIFLGCPSVFLRFPNMHISGLFHFWTNSCKAHTRGNALMASMSSPDCL